MIAELLADTVIRRIKRQSTRARASDEEYTPAVMVKDLHGVVRYQNRLCEKLFGYVVGKSTEERMPWEQATKARRRDEQAMRSTWRPVLFARTITIKGERMRFQVAKYPFVNRSGEVAGVVCTICRIDAHAPTVSRDDPKE